MCVRASTGLIDMYEGAEVVEASGGERTRVDMGVGDGTYSSESWAVPVPRKVQVHFHTLRASGTYLCRLLAPLPVTEKVPGYPRASQVHGSSQYVPASLVEGEDGCSTRGKDTDPWEMGGTYTPIAAAVYGQTFHEPGRIPSGTEALRRLKRAVLASRIRPDRALYPQKGIYIHKC